MVNVEHTPFSPLIFAEDDSFRFVKESNWIFTTASYTPYTSCTSVACSIDLRSFTNSFLYPNSELINIIALGIRYNHLRWCIYDLYMIIIGAPQFFIKKTS